MLITKQVEVKWNRRTSTHYKARGYLFTKIGETFFIDIADLPEGSHAIVSVQCDFCGVLLDKSYKTYLQQRKNHPVDSCLKCKNHKMVLTMQRNHGVSNPMQIEENKLKQRKSTLENNGVEFALQSERSREKWRKTNTEKYGVDHYAKTDECKDKMKQTNLERHGVEYYSMSDDFNIKVKNTVQSRYGVDFISQIPGVKRKKAQTMNSNGTTPTSKQQVHLHTLIGGELNYPVGQSSLDIAFEEELVYVEYDGGGHNLGVKLGEISQEEFDLKEKRRTFRLFDLGWKEIRFVSDKDKLPSDFEILKTFEKAKSFLIQRKNKSIIIDWDNRKVLISFKMSINLDDFLKDDYEFVWEVA